jgi:Rrf2 family protein
VTRVKSIEYWVERDKRDSVQAGMSVGITVEDEFFNKRGEVISHKKDVPIVGTLFKANLFWLGKRELVKNKKYKLKLATQEMECEISSIDRVIDASTLETIQDANEIKINDVAEVTIKTRQAVCFDAFRNNQNTGRFVIVDGFDVSGGGIIVGAAQEDSSMTQQEDHIRIFMGCLKLDISKKVRYALRAMVEIEVHSKEQGAALKDIAQRQNISGIYLEQILPVLVEAGLIKSFKDAEEKYVLGEPALKITVADVLRLFDEKLSIIDENVSEDNINAGVENSLAVNVWGKMNESINAIVESITLEDLIKEYKKFGNPSVNMYYI